MLSLSMDLSFISLMLMLRFFSDSCLTESKAALRASLTVFKLSSFTFVCGSKLLIRIYFFLTKFSSAIVGVFFNFLSFLYLFSTLYEGGTGGTTVALFVRNGLYLLPSSFGNFGNTSIFFVSARLTGSLAGSSIFVLDLSKILGTSFGGFRSNAELYSRCLVVKSTRERAPALVLCYAKAVRDSL